jgi:hypothetical protein
MNTKIKERFDIDIPVTTMFRFRTIREIAAFIQKEEINLQVSDEVMAESVTAMDDALSFWEEDDNE